MKRKIVLTVVIMALALFALLFFCLRRELQYSFASQAAAEGNWQEAGQKINQLLIDEPDRADLLYDAGVSAFNMDELRNALAYFQGAAADKNASDLLKEQAHFNSGNAHFKLHELQEAVDEYEKVLALNDQNEWAQYNRDLIKKLLEEQKQEQQNNQQQNDKDQQSKDDQKQQEQQNQQRNKQQSSKQNDNQSQQEPERNKDKDQQQDNGGQPKDEDDPSDQRDQESGEQQKNQPENGRDLADKKEKKEEKKQNKQRNNNGEAQNESEQKEHNESKEKNKSGDHKPSLPKKRDKKEPKFASNDTQESAKKQGANKGGGVANGQGAEQTKGRSKEAQDPWVSAWLERCEKADEAVNKKMIKATIDKNLVGKRGQNCW